ncbi:hypothetical protein BKH26_02230 [Actinomyces oris]|nr:hypothetical protein BKH26_02230 [Actinomyces oris]
MTDVKTNPLNGEASLLIHDRIATHRQHSAERHPNQPRRPRRHLTGRLVSLLPHIDQSPRRTKTIPCQLLQQPHTASPPALLHQRQLLSSRQRVSGPGFQEPLGDQKTVRSSPPTLTQLLKREHPATVGGLIQ